jgi:magnesium chelatase subunit D
LRAAAPWQGLRAREDSHTIPGLVRIRASDLKVRERAQCPALAILFVVDASGSSAAHRLGEAKGAVQLLLADCYVRRDRVGLISFRGRSADILLEPTRSLTRAKRSLAALPGGGATPLATAIDTVVVEVERITKRGQTPIVVFLTDARANVARDGTQGRERAANDVNQAATALRARRTPTLLVDTGVRASPAAESLARTLGARYLALPEVGALDLSQAVRHAAHRSAPGRPA